MADVAGPSSSEEVQYNDMELCEPAKKKVKLENKENTPHFKLEERLNGILCCAVCLDLPNVAVFQCTNGHLMCAGCFSHLLADGRLKDESATCPNCRCEISRTSCSRNLAVEKAISELPTECRYCSKLLPRSGLKHHEKELCQERLVSCKYRRIGCPWCGPYHELQGHQGACPHPHKSGDEIMEAMATMDQDQDGKALLYSRIFRLLSFEKIAFNDLQLRPYRTDDFITRLFYETGRFTAFNVQWVVKASVTEEKPEHSNNRQLQFQLISKSKLQNPMRVHFVALKGPYGEMHLDPSIYEHEFASDSTESASHVLPLNNSVECNKLLAAKTISLRLIMFLVPKSN